MYNRECGLKVTKHLLSSLLQRKFGLPTYALVDSSEGVHGNNIPWKWSYLLARWTTALPWGQHETIKYACPFNMGVYDQTRKTAAINLTCYWSLKTRFSGTNIRVLYYFWGFYSLDILQATTQRISLTFDFIEPISLEGKSFLYTEVFLSVKKDQVILLFLIVQETVS